MENAVANPSKFSGMRMDAGDVHVFYGPCGGGYGDPLERPAEQVLDDVLDDFCTIAHAQQAYGVVIDLANEAVDQAATTALRTELGAAPRPQPAAPVAARQIRPTPRLKAPAPSDDLGPLVRRLRQAFGDDWSFEIVEHQVRGDAVHVVGQLHANGAEVRHSGRANGANGQSLGQKLEAASNDSLRKCATVLLDNGVRQDTLGG